MRKRGIQSKNGDGHRRDRRRYIPMNHSLAGVGGSKRNVVEREKRKSFSWITEEF